MLDIFQIILAIIIIGAILIQQRGTEGGVLFGNRTNFFLKRRGIEKNIYYFTWIMIILFILASLFKLLS